VRQFLADEFGVRDSLSGVYALLQRVDAVVAGAASPASGEGFRGPGGVQINLFSSLGIPEIAAS
jgi:hypothetical protein